MGPMVLGFDLGGTKVSAAVFDGDGKILGRARAKTKAWRSSEDVFETIARTGMQAVESAGVADQVIDAIGIGSPGPLDPDTGYIIESANLGFKDFPLGPRLAERFNCPVVLDNDVNVGTYGEFKVGAARGTRHVLGMFVGTGIGGGIIIDGSLYHGYSKNAGEVGHMVIRAGGPRCGCGNRGCLEAFASRTGMDRQIRKAIKRGRKSMLADAVKANRGPIRSGALKEAYDSGDELAKSVVRLGAKYVGIGIGSLVNVLGPEVVVLGGGVIEALGDEIMARIDKAARKNAFEYAIKDVKIVRAELGDDAGVIGAAMLAKEAVIDRVLKAGESR